MFHYTPANADKRIAGRHTGKPITITPQAEPIWNELVKLANAGNYWAQLTVRGIEQLAAGRLSQNNIFVKPGSVHRGGTEEFVVILPGCKVTAEKLPNDSYKLLLFEADLHYGQLIEQGMAPGLYQVEKEDSWKSRLRIDGKIEKANHRVVAISDSGYEDPEEAAQTAAISIVDSPVSGGAYTLSDTGFDLHFTPGENKIGGLKNYKKALRPLKDQDLHNSAMLLARVMYMAKDQKRIRWIAEYGGSAVLTQAFKILSDRKIKLNQHTAFLVRPTTSPHEAIKAVHAVEGVILDRKFSAIEPLNYIGNRDGLAVVKERRKREIDYTWKMAATDRVLAGTNINGAIGFVAGGAALMGLAVSVPATCAFLTVLGGAAAVTAKAGVLGKMAMESWAPRKYNELKSKL